MTVTIETWGGARNFPTGADSSDEGAKIWFSGYYKRQKSPKKSPFTFRLGATMLQREGYNPWSRHKNLKLPQSQKAAQQAESC